MESSTELARAEDGLQKMIESGWSDCLQGLGSDLEESARRSKALQRERKIKGAANLLRLILAYGVCDYSLRLVGAWAALQGIAQVSDVALLYRFRQSSPWLGKLVMQVLQQHNQYLVQDKGVRVRLMDATVISQPGSVGTDWRVHLSMDLGSLSVDGIQVTDAQGAENLARFACRGDEIWVGDRGYSYASGIGAALASAARLVVRLNWRSLPLQTESRQRLNILDWLKTVSVQQERNVWIATPQGGFALRLIACPLSSAEAAQARERVRKQATKKGKPLNPDTWLAAGFILLITNLPSDTWEAARMLWLYRLRWQIELQFKRLKSLLQLDHLRAQDPHLVQTYLLAKLLAALLLDHLTLLSQTRVPDWFQSLQRPLSLWRLHACLGLGIQQLVTGFISIPQFLFSLPILQRYLCDTPRDRPQQAAWARSVVRRFGLAPT